MSMLSPPADIDGIDYMPEARLIARWLENLSPQILKKEVVAWRERRCAGSGIHHSTASTQVCAPRRICEVTRSKSAR